MGLLKRTFWDVVDSMFRPKKYAKRKKGRQNVKKGLTGEKITVKELKSLGFGDCTLHDIIIRDSKTGKMAQLDVVVVTRDEIAIIEVKTQNFHTVKGSVTSEDWTLVYGKGSMFKSGNIYSQVDRQRKALRNVLNKHNIALPIRSYILVRSDNTVRVQVEGLQESGVQLVQSARMAAPRGDKRPHKLALRVLEDENRKNTFVRRYHSK